MNAKNFALVILLIALLAAGCAAARPAVEVVRTVEVEKEVAMQAAAPAEATSVAMRPGNSAPGLPSSAGRMVIKDAEIELLVSDTGRALSQVTQMAADYGGYVVSSQTWYDGGFKYATLRLGIPSDSFENALNYLRNLGLQVLKENATGQDVSAEYTDLQSRLSNLEATAARVRSFLEQANTVEDSLRINTTLSDLEGQIEQVKGQMKYYEGRAAFSSITVTLTPQRPTPTPTLTPTPTPAWNPGATFHHASGVLVDLSKGTVDVLIWVAVVLGPALLTIGIVFWAGRSLLRRNRSRARTG